MPSALHLLSVSLLTVRAAAHYGKPPCQSDESRLQLAGTGGELCAPKCGSGDACPQDLPPGDVVKPRCALNTADGKYCALTCYFGKCPDGALCKWPSGGAIVGYCVYPTNDTLSAAPEKAAPLDATPFGSLGTDKCSTLCQPDPDYSKTSYCKHKDRGGCCVEVNPNWDNVPGWKHMTDFCDKLCMPDGPGKLATCEPPKEFEKLVETATDPLDAIDKFYENNPAACSDRIGDWVEANCPHEQVVV